MTSNLATSLHFSPILSATWIWGICLLGAILLILALYKHRNGLILRALVFTAFILALLNPSVLQEERSYTKDVAVIIVDQSHSQSFEKRTNRTENALEHLKNEIQESKKFDLRIIKAPKNGFSTRTDLFEALDQTLADVPVQKRAGVIFLTDGQIHDIPKDDKIFTSYGPVHVLLSGHKNEKDRQIIVTNAPAYGLLGKAITVKYRIEDSKNIGETEARVVIKHHDGHEDVTYARIGEEQSITLNIEHPSQNIFSRSVETVENEISIANNKTALIVNGVRDRLKVMLISGIPHPGERTWRDLLTSDPGIDLVHFTILREPQKFDFTPKKELSLIAFPFHELFDVKLYDFDLIIFDRYRVHNILRDKYFENIAKFVENGGAFLAATGPDFAGKRSLYKTPLQKILPGIPTGRVIEEKFKPTLTQTGNNHPVTRSLVFKETNDKASQSTQSWGDWMRYIDIKPARGDILMTAMNNNPLLVLDRVGKGRVAQLSSDHIWLWSRGYDGGGPHAELLRRVVHWLMKEPELDERALDVRINGNKITVQKQAFQKSEETIALTKPDGNDETLNLHVNEDGILSATITAKDLGIYAFEDVNKTRKLAIVGDLDPLELRSIRTTDKAMEPIITASKGTAIWLSETPTPTVISSSSNARRYGGSDWLGLKQNNHYTVKGVKDSPLLPTWFIIAMLLSLLVFTWWKESHSK